MKKETVLLYSLIIFILSFFLFVVVIGFSFSDQQGEADATQAIVQLSETERYVEFDGMPCLQIKSKMTGYWDTVSCDWSSWQGTIDESGIVITGY